MYYLYIWHSTPNYTKVGISQNPQKRLSLAQANNPELMTLSAQIEYPNRDVAEQAETQLCFSLQRYKQHGEWFQIETEDLIALLRFIEISLLHTIAISYPEFKVQMRNGNSAKLNQKAAIQYIRDNQTKYEQLKAIVLRDNPTASQRLIAEAISESMTGKKHGYMTVIRAYKKLGIKL